MLLLNFFSLCCFKTAVLELNKQNDRHWSATTAVSFQVFCERNSNTNIATRFPPAYNIICNSRCACYFSEVFNFVCICYVTRTGWESKFFGDTPVKYSNLIGLPNTRYHRIHGNKMPTRCNRWFLLQVLLLAQHVSGTTIPIIRSSRVLYRWSLPVVFGALVFKLSVWCGAEGYVSGLQAAGILFPHINDDARSESLQNYMFQLLCVTL